MILNLHFYDIHSLVHKFRFYRNEAKGLFIDGIERYFYNSFNIYCTENSTQSGYATLHTYYQEHFLVDT